MIFTRNYFFSHCGQIISGLARPIWKKVVLFCLFTSCVCQSTRKINNFLKFNSLFMGERSKNVVHFHFFFKNTCKNYSFCIFFIFLVDCHVRHFTNYGFFFFFFQMIQSGDNLSAVEQDFFFRRNFNATYIKAK